MAKNPAAPIRILVTDDHDIVRRQVTNTLKSQPGFEVVGEATNGLEGVQKAEQLAPDVVVLNVAMPIMNGFEAARKIRSKLPDVAIVVLSSNADKRFIEEAKKCGARAFVSKNSAGDALVEAIEAALRGDDFFVVE